MSTLELAVAFTEQNEGGWSDNPLDAGGATNMGITFATLKDAAAKLHGHTYDPVLDGNITIDTLKNITLEQVEEIVTVEGMWTPNYEQLSTVIAIKTFDFGFNMGARSGVKLLQTAINGVHPSAVGVDGILGSHTVTAANSCEQSLLLTGLIGSATRHYQAIVNYKPSQQEFLKGWLNRARRLPKLA